MAVVSHLRILFSLTATFVASTKLLGPYFYVHVAATAPTSVPALAPAIYVRTLIYVAAISYKPMEIQKKTTLLKLADYFLLSRSQCKKRFTKHVQRRLLWLYSIYVRI